MKPQALSSRQSVATRNLLYSAIASVVLNLYTFNVYFSSSLSLLTFCRAKSYKNARHRQNKAQQPFARAVLASTRPAVRCYLDGAGFSLDITFADGNPRTKGIVFSLKTFKSLKTLITLRT